MTDVLDALSDEDRKVLKAADLNKMDDSDFAYVDGNGDRHLPVHDEAHVRAALARFNQTQFDTPADKASAAKKVLAAAKKFGIEVDDSSPVAQAARSDETDTEERADCPTCGGKKTIMDGHRKCPDCNGTGLQQNSAEVDSEERNDPTPEDADVTALIKEAHDVLARLRVAQGADPDGKSDPDDKDVSKAIGKASDALDNASAAQAADNKPERSRKPRHRSTKLAPEFRRGIGREIRLYSAGDIEVREVRGQSDTVEVTGSPIVYNQPYSVRDIFGEFEETMMPGVASKVLKNADCRFLINHDGLPLARTVSGTLKFKDTPDALNFSAFLDTRSSQANDLIVAIERGDVSQMSCGFVVADDDWNEAQTQRSIFRFDELLDVSAVTYPASPTTSIDIANRMMMEVPVESRARVQKLWSFAATELRGGKVLSDENAAHIKNAAQALQAVLSNAGEAPDADEDVQSKSGADGTQNANSPDPATAQDGTGSRGKATATELRLELDLIKARRRAA